MLDDVLSKMSFDEINDKVPTIKNEPVGTFGGRKFSILDSKGEKHIFSMRDMLNHLNDQVDKNFDSAKAKLAFSTLLYKDSNNEVTIKEHGLLKYIFTQLKRFANIGFNKNQMIESIYTKIQDKENLRKIERDILIDSHRVNETIGSKEYPLTTVQIMFALEELKKKLGENKVQNLIIYAKNIDFSIDPAIIDLDPKKLILVNAASVPKNTFARDLCERLAAHEDWEGRGGRERTGPVMLQHEVASVEEAIKEEVQRSESGRKLNRIYVVQPSS